MINFDSAHNNKQTDNLPKVIDFVQLNSLFAPFLTAMNLPVYLITVDGAVLASSADLTRCTESDSQLIAQLQSGSSYATHQCSHGGIHCAAPVVVENCHLANLFTGQCSIELADNHQADREKLPALTALLVSWTQQIATQSLAKQRAITELHISDANAERATQEKAAFIAHLSHKLRSPLTAIMGFSQLLLYDDKLPKEHYECAEIIHNSGNHLLTIINNAVLNNENSKTEKQTPSLLISQDFQVMPDEWLIQLSNALLQGETAQLVLLIQDIPATHAFLIEQLTKLVREFQFEHILNFIEPLMTSKH
jgi:signal transduction histidine kinase